MRYGILFCLLFVWSVAAGEIFVQEKAIKLPGAYYFLPLRVHDNKAAFGYISKIKPTPQEIRQEQRRIRHIIEASIEREYGSMQEWERENAKLGEQVATQIQKRSPAWLHALLPPQLVQEAVPFLLRGALFFAMHAKTSKEPYGNLGETGVVIVDKGVHKIKVGIDEPIISLDFSPDGRYLAAMSDLSYEDSRGRYQALARITLIDAKSYKILHQWVFANAVDELKFTPDGQLSFLTHDPKKWVKKRIHFIDLRTKRLLRKRLSFVCGTSEEWLGGIKIRHACYLYAPRGDLLLTREAGKLGFYDPKTLQKRFKLPGTFFVGFAHTKPLLVDRSGEVIDYAKGEVLYRFKDPLGCGFVMGAFMPDDKEVIFSDDFRHFFIFDLRFRRKVAQTRKLSDGGKIFMLTGDGRWIITQHIGSKHAIYQGFLKRARSEIKVVDARSLQTKQLIKLPPDQTVLAFVLAKEQLYWSDFDTFYIYKRVR